MWTWCSKRTCDHVSLIIEDNGVGFDASNAETVGEGLGLIGCASGLLWSVPNLQIESTPGRGTSVILRAPVVAPASKSA